MQVECAQKNRVYIPDVFVVPGDKYLVTVINRQDET